MKKLLKRIGDAMRYCLHGVVKTHSDEPNEPRDDMRVVQSPDGKYAVQSWSRWGGWTFYGFNEFNSKESAIEAINSAREHKAKQKEREQKAWSPLNES